MACSHSRLWWFSFPWVFRDKVAAFWFAAMILAAIPEAVLVPLSKNLGFIAVGAYGLIASFVAGVVTRPNSLLEQRAYRILAWVACVLLILVHGPGAVAGRVAVVKADAFLFAWASRVPPAWPNIENENVIVVNHPLPLESAYVPAYKAYYHQLLPRTLRVLVPGCTGFDVQRTDDKTLVIQSQGSNIFSCDDVGPIHIAYALSACNQLLRRTQMQKRRPVSSERPHGRSPRIRYRRIWLPALRSGSTPRWIRPISAGSGLTGEHFPASPLRYPPSDKASRCPAHPHDAYGSLPASFGLSRRKHSLG